MSKYKLLLIASSYFVLMVMMASAIEGITATEDMIGPGNIGFTSGGIFSWIGTFLRLTFFQLDGVPMAMNVPFTILVIPMVYMTFEIVKDIIPFT